MPCVTPAGFSRVRDTPGYSIVHTRAAERGVVDQGPALAPTVDPASSAAGSLLGRTGIGSRPSVRRRVRHGHRRNGRSAGRAGKHRTGRGRADASRRGCRTGPRGDLQAPFRPDRIASSTRRRPLERLCGGRRSRLSRNLGTYATASGRSGSGRRGRQPLLDQPVLGRGRLFCFRTRAARLLSARRGGLDGGSRSGLRVWSLEGFA
jgi:hypothetical protein